MNYTSRIDHQGINPRWYLAFPYERNEEEQKQWEMMKSEQSLILSRFIEEINLINKEYDCSLGNKTILFNKGKYIETLCVTKAEKSFVHRSAKIKSPDYLINSLIVVASIEKIEAVVHAFCKLGYRTTIKLDWI